MLPRQFMLFQKGGRRSAKAIHLVHPEPVSLHEFVQLFPSPLPLMPYDSWASALNEETKQGDDPSLLFVSLLARGLSRADLTPPAFDCSRTMAALQETDIACPALDRKFVRNEFSRGR